MKLAFMTLGCPDWDLDTIIARGSEYGFDGVDFRGIRENLDVTVLPEFTTEAATTRRRLADAGLEVSAISSSLQICNPDKREADLEEARRTIPVARAFGAGFIRVFGGGDLEAHPRETLRQAGIDLMHEILALDGATEVTWMFETHDNWIAAPEVLGLINGVDSPHFRVLWDMAHCFRLAQESPADCLAAYGEKVVYAHIKDAVYEPENPKAMKDGWYYVHPGEGQLPIGEAVERLKNRGYDGWLQYEHEKRWHRDLPEPEEMFPAFVRWARHFT